MIKKHDGDEAKRKEPPSKKMEPEHEHVTYLGDATRGTVGRNSTFRPDARTRLENLGIYDDVANIKKGIAEQNNIKKLSQSKREAEINKRAEFFKFKAKNMRTRYEYIYSEITDDKGKTKKKRERKPGSGRRRKLLNFSDAGVPYGNQAHHILCCEAFSKENGWTPDLVGIVKDTTYDINNDFNIIYLPTVFGKQAKKTEVPPQCLYHKLPNHGKGHNFYNEKVNKDVAELIVVAKKATKKPKNCKMSEKLPILDELYEGLLSIEDDYLDYIKSRGANLSIASKP